MLMVVGTLRVPSKLDKAQAPSRESSIVVRGRLQSNINDQNAALGRRIERGGAKEVARPPKTRRARGATVHRAGRLSRFRGASQNRSPYKTGRRPSSVSPRATCRSKW